MPEPYETPPPAAIVVSATLWDLEAEPATLQEAATALRARAMRAAAAQATVDDSAILLTTNEHWVGDSADLYQGHRRRLTGDLGDLATTLGESADALDHIASVLTFWQSQLDTEWATIAAIPHPRSGHDFRFQPSTEAEAALVRDAMSAATDIRAYVDAEIALKESDLSTAQEDLATIKETWQPRTIRVLDLNVGQGYKNSPWDSRGTDRGDIDEIGQIIANSRANVVTLQEMFDNKFITSDGDAHRLRDWLEENTGEGWQLHFATADHKPYWSDSNIPDGANRPFGNAILVRVGDGIADSEELDELTLQEPGALSSLNIGAEGRSMEGAHIEFTD